MQEYTITETEETIDTLYAYGSVSSDLVGERLIFVIEDNTFFIKKSTGEYIYSKNEDGYADKDFEATDTKIIAEYFTSEINIDELENFIKQLKKA